MLAISYFKLPTRQFGNHDKLEPKTVVTCLLNLVGKLPLSPVFVFGGTWSFLVAQRCACNHPCAVKVVGGQPLWGKLGYLLLALPVVSSGN